MGTLRVSVHSPEKFKGKKVTFILVIQTAIDFLSENYLQVPIIFNIKNGLNWLGNLPNCEGRPGINFSKHVCGLLLFFPSSLELGLKDESKVENIDGQVI